LMAISNLAKKYKLEGKKLHLINISSDCLEVIEDAKQMVDINVLKDDKYRLAETRSKLLDKLKEQNIN